MLQKTIIGILIYLFIIVPTVNSQELRFGILPVIDTLPLQVAIKEGYFKEQNLNVKLIPFSSAMERNTAVHSRQLDGYFGDLIATLLLIDKGSAIRVLTISYQTNPNQRMFGLVTTPKQNNPTENSTLSVAISKASIIEYLLSHIKQLPGAAKYRYEPVEIKQMPIRLQMLLAGKIDSALLPEPLASLAISKGAKLLATDQSLNMPLTILNMVERKLSTKGAFLKAYGKAVSALNRNPEAYRSLMAKTCRIPKPLVATFPMYKYPSPRLPTEEEVNQVQTWMLANGLLKTQLPYSNLVP